MELLCNLIKTFILLCISLFVNCEVVMNWNKCPLESSALRSFHRVSVNECLKQCHIRNHCQLICYRTGMQLCEIHSSTDAITDCKRCMSVFREHIPADQFGEVCDCDDGQTCNLQTGKCEYTECTYFPTSPRLIYGNAAYVNSKRRYRCLVDFTKKNYEVTCSNSGFYKKSQSCRQLCPSSGDLITVTEEFRARIFSQVATQQEAKDNCSAIGGALIKIDQAYKLDALRQVLKFCPDFKKDCWVDGFSETPSILSTWKFSDGAPLPTDIGEFWSSIIPDDSRQCIKIRERDNFLFNARRCDMLNWYICEMI